jgi:hypothetical protein
LSSAKRVSKPGHRAGFDTPLRGYSTSGITAETGMAVFWFVEMCALALPSMVLALLDRELPR